MRALATPTGQPFEPPEIAEVTLFLRPLPSAVEMHGHLARLVGMQPWEPRTKGE